jgi:outer membrane protein TolC
VATADLFPHVALTGGLGMQSANIGAHGSHIWGFGPSVYWPLLDFGALDAQVETADLGRRAALLNYRRTVIGAVRDVDTALVGLQAERSRLRHLGDGVVAGERALTLATERYDRGLTPYLEVIDAQRALYELESQYVAAQVGEAEQFVALYRNLGGGWQNYQAVPGVRTPQPAVLAALRHLLGTQATEP